nr:MAG TPA: hypothetical protein [Caudoviricetes sp.]
MFTLLLVTPLHIKTLERFYYGGRLITSCPLVFATRGVLIAIAVHYKYSSLASLPV